MEAKLDGVEAAKFLGLSGLVAFVTGYALLVLPADAPYLQSSLCAAMAVALVAYLLAIRPAAKWQRTALVFMATGLCLIAVAIVIAA